MDFVQSLLLMDDDLEENDKVEQTAGEASDTDPGPSSEVPWCKCHKCCITPQEIENRCCGQRK